MDKDAHLRGLVIAYMKDKRYTPGEASLMLEKEHNITYSGKSIYTWIWNDYRRGKRSLKAWKLLHYFKAPRGRPVKSKIKDRHLKGIERRCEEANNRERLNDFEAYLILAVEELRLKDPAFWACRPFKSRHLLSISMTLRKCMVSFDPCTMDPADLRAKLDEIRAMLCTPAEFLPRNTGRTSQNRANTAQGSQNNSQGTPPDTHAVFQAKVPAVNTELVGLVLGGLDDDGGALYDTSLLELACRWHS